MARVTLKEQDLSFRRFVLNVENVCLTDEQFFRLCSDNPELNMELTAQKELIIMPPAGLKSNWRENFLATELTIWARKDGTGVAFSCNAGYVLPNSAKRAPDVSWIRRDRLAVFSDKELEKFGHLCPDFLAEILSPTNTLEELRDKMDEYMANGARLGWLIDPYEGHVYVYRPGKVAEELVNPATLSGDPVLPGFVLSVAEVLAGSW